MRLRVCERRSIRAIGFLVALCCATVGLGDTASAREENPDADTFARYQYRPDTEQGLVNVTITLEVTADKADQRTAGGIFQYYLEGYALTIPVSARNLTVTDAAGRDLVHDVVYTDEWFQTLTFEFRRNIFYRQTATVVIDYDLVEDRDDEYRLARVNDAYIAIEVWPDPLLEEATVDVVTSSGFELDVPFADGAGDFVATEDGDEIRFAAADVDPETFYAVLSLERPERLVTQELEVEGHPILLQSWPGDDEWTSAARNAIESGLPLLIDAVDLEWPIDDELAVTESYDPTLAGYGGWFDSSDDEISLGDIPDNHLIIHELAHLWFRHELFTDRWITEGLAEHYAADVVEAMDQDRPEPEPASLLDSVAIPLREWSPVIGVDPELERWAYAASWTVTADIVQEVGAATMDAVIQAAAAREVAYPGDGEPEVSRAPRNWKWYLDLIQNRAGESTEAVGDLFEDWVAAESDRAMLATRAETRERYFDLLKRGDGWAAPVTVRTAMSMWAFPAASDRMDVAEGLLDRRNALVESLGEIDVALPLATEKGYEDSTDPEMTDVDELIGEAEMAAETLLDAHRSVSDADGVFQRIGAIGSNLDADLRRAGGSFSDGDFDAVADSARSTRREVEGLARLGMIRAAITSVTVLATGLGGSFLIRRRRRNQRPEQFDVPTVRLRDR